VADGERTASEREAARLERERRRAARTVGAPVEVEHPPEPEVEAADEHEVEAADEPEPPPEAEPEAADEPELEPEAADELDLEPPPELEAPAAAAQSPEHEPELDGHFDTDEHDVELPSGTRRVSRLETIETRRDNKGPIRRRHKPARTTSTRRKWLVRAGALTALVVGAALIWFVVELFQPFGGSPHGHVTVEIPPHASSSQIGDILANDGVVGSSLFFELRATLDGKRSDLRPGIYHLQLGMTYGAVLTALTKAPPAARVMEMTITEGQTRHSVDSLLRAQGVHGSYLAATRKSPLVDPGQYGLKRAPVTLEGFLFPDTYDLVEPIKISALVADQLGAFKQNFAKVNLNYARSKHLTPYDVLTIASLIQAEAATARDRPLVASVIYNRLADGMMLQFDSTTRFATGNYTRPLTVSQLRSRSAWNTHTHLGLPPTPIDSPGVAAIAAAAHPAHTNYLFFFTRPCGRGAVYASSYSQFLSQGSQNPAASCKHK
jgi:UPF0755 protein